MQQRCRMNAKARWYVRTMCGLMAAIQGTFLACEVVEYRGAADLFGTLLLTAGVACGCGLAWVASAD
jgi:hypothetical protein